MMHHNIVFEEAKGFRHYSLVVVVGLFCFGGFGEQKIRLRQQFHFRKRRMFTDTS